MTRPVSRADFAALLRRAGLDVPEPEVDELFTGWSHIEPMLDRLRGTAARGREVESALIFRPDAFTEAALAEDALTKESHEERAR